jgi:hypothetical protein
MLFVLKWVVGELPVPHAVHDLARELVIYLWMTLGAQERRNAWRSVPTMAGESTTVDIRRMPVLSVQSLQWSVPP